MREKMFYSCVFALHCKPEAEVVSVGNAGASPECPCV